MKNIIVLKSSLVADALGHLRNRDSSLVEFRWYSDQICRMLFLEATTDLESKKTTVITPLNVQAEARQIPNNIVIIPILRAGIAMLPSALQTFPQAKVGFIGLERDEKTAIARKYYCKLPIIDKKSVVIIVDPMLATGGSLVHSLGEIKKFRPKKIKIVCVIAAPEGIANFQSVDREIVIYTAAIDSHLNAKKYIVPGLGDYGDRYFGTD